MRQADLAQHGGSCCSVRRGDDGAKSNGHGPGHLRHEPMRYHGDTGGGEGIATTARPPTEAQFWSRSAGLAA